MSLKKNGNKEEKVVKKLTISLVTYNAASLLEACIIGIQQQSIYKECEVIVFDNASVDRSVAIIEKEFSSDSIIRSPHNRGFAIGHNEIIRRTKTPYVLILNQDVFLDPFYCQRCISFLEIHPDVGSVSGKLFSVASLTPPFKTDTIDSCGLRLVRPLHHFSNLYHGKRADKMVQIQEVFGIPGTAAFYRRSALHDSAIPRNGSLEYFDEDFFMYKEDVDLAYRLRHRNWRSFVIPDAIAFHIRTAKSRFLIFRHGSREIARWSYSNHIFLLIKNVSIKTYIRFFIPIFLYEIAKFFYSIICQPHVFLALYDVWRLRKVMIKKRAYIMGRRCA